MVLASFYQNFMESLDEHINELVEVKCTKIIKTLQNQIDDLRRENKKLFCRLNGAADAVPRLDTIDNDCFIEKETNLKSEKFSEDPIYKEEIVMNFSSDRMDEDESPEDNDDVTHFQEYANGVDDCPDLEEIGKDDENELFNCSDNYGEKTIDETEMEAYFNDENFLCRVCNRQLCSRHSLMRHVKTVHTAVRRYKCEYCDSSFKSADVRKVHVKNVHANAKQCLKPFKPTTKRSESKRVENEEVTPMATNNTNNYEVGGKIFSCSICKERFSSRGEISGHSRRAHGNTKPFKCEFCDAGFTRVGTLNMHLKKHTL